MKAFEKSVESTKAPTIKQKISTKTSAVYLSVAGENKNANLNVREPTLSSPAKLFPQRSQITHGTSLLYLISTSYALALLYLSSVFLFSDSVDLQPFLNVEQSTLFRAMTLFRVVPLFSVDPLFRVDAKKSPPWLATGSIYEIK